MAAADESPDTTALLKQLRKLAYQDPLTGLLNRRGFDEELRRLWNLDDAQAFPLGLLIIDIDHFKTINDSFGHFVGDQVLKECAQRMQASVREDDLVCRYYGGDEMVVLLPRASRAEAQAAADRLLEKFRGEVICKGSYDLRMTISIGACHIPAPVEPTGDRFLIQADRALYRAKQSGRNRACFADDLPDPISDTNGAAHPVAPAGMADTRRTVLVADDDLDVCRYFERVLTRDQFSVLMAHNGADAIALLKQATGMVDVALIDLRLGEEDGLDLLKQLLALDSSIIGVIITGAATVDDAVGALRMGAYDFIQKPIASGQLTAVLERATKYRRLVLENKRYQLHLEDMVREKNAALSRALDNISDTFQFTLEAITDILDVREHQTGEHSRRVARLAIVLAREMGAWPEDIQTIETGALLHDIGKIGVPDSIFSSPALSPPTSAPSWTAIPTSATTSSRLGPVSRRSPKSSWRIRNATTAAAIRWA